MASPFEPASNLCHLPDVIQFILPAGALRAEWAKDSVRQPALETKRLFATFRDKNVRPTVPWSWRTEERKTEILPSYSAKNA